MAHAAALVDPSKPFEALRDREIFSRLDDSILGDLAPKVSFLDLAPKERLGPHIDPHAVERLYFVLEGQMGVVRPRMGSELLDLPRHHLPNPDNEYLMFFGVGDVFSDAYVSEHGPDDSANLDVTALVRTLLVAIKRTDLLKVLRDQPGWAELVESKVDAAREQYQKHRTPRLRVVQDFFLQHNYSYASTMRVIDLGLCIGCDGCERACESRHGLTRLRREGPALGRLGFPVTCRTCEDHRCLPACGFDALDMKNHELRIDQMKCVGCAACHSACPNDVITMHEKPYVVEDFPNPMPNTDLSGRTNVPGVFLVGEASGAALIKVAINGGRGAVEEAHKELEGQAKVDGIHDLIIVGAGPAGLSASLTALELELDFKVFDKGHFATTIQSYPRNKVVMAEPAHIPLYGNLWLKDTTKEELIGHWTEIIRRTGLEIQSHEPVTNVQSKGPDDIEVTTTKGTYRAKRVVLCTGTRGSPRKIGCTGEEEPRVQYVLTDPDDYKGKKVLVVGGGDSAVEAAMSMADTGKETIVALSYRRDKFGRIKPRNKDRLAEYEAVGKVRVILSSEVKALDPGTARLSVEGQDDVILDNEVVLAMLGAEPPTKFFQKIGIEIFEPGSKQMTALAKSRGDRRYANKCDHCADYEDQACITACPTGAILEIKPTDIFAESRQATHREELDEEPFSEGVEREARSAWAFGALAVATLIACVVGAECFLRRMLPEWSFAHYYNQQIGLDAPVGFRSGDGLGYWLGIIGTTLMGLTALYPIHSRLGLFRRFTKTRFWLGAHILAGLLGPLFVSYHTTMKLDRWPTVGFALMWVIVFTGAVGRYIYPRVRSANSLADLEVNERSFGLLLNNKAGTGLEKKLLWWRRFHIALTLALVVVAALHIASSLLFKVS